jgi:hypothetical protein
METSEKAQTLTPVTIVAVVSLFLIGMAALAPVSLEIAPYSFVTIIPAFLVSGILGEKFLIVGAVLGSLIAPIGYIMAARYISRSGNTLPKASVITFVLVSVLSLASAVSGWDLTIRYISATRAIALVIQALSPALLILLIGFICRKSLTVRRSLVLHWAAFAWLSWSAFPWYGELL